MRVLVIFEKCFEPTFRMDQKDFRENGYEKVKDIEFLLRTITKISATIDMHIY